MHDTARITGAEFFRTYGHDAKSVLDVGSMDVNGTLRPFVPEGANYCGLDMAAGPNVTLVLQDPYKFPLTSGEFDVCVSSSCLEHDSMFWLTFNEMVRTTRRYVYLSVPMLGTVHRHPVDCWRFFPDAGRALEAWGRRSGFDVRLLESFIIPPRSDQWFDFVAVFGLSGNPVRGLVACFPEAFERVICDA